MEVGNIKKSATFKFFSPSVRWTDHILYRQTIFPIGQKDGQTTLYIDRLYSR